MPFVPVAGVDIYFETHGSGPAVVLAHGLGGNHAIWWRQIDYFASHYRVITFDAEGYGLSRSKPDRPGPPASTVVGTLLDELEVEEAILVGQSMGGGTCWEYTAQHPQRVRALVMSASAGPLGSSDAMDLRARLESVQVPAQNLTQPERVFAPEFRANHPSDVLLYTQISSFGEVTQSRLGGAKPPMTTSPREIRNVAVPTLFVAGGHDRLLPVDILRDVARLANASFVELPLSGHSPFFECPDLYNYVLHSFFRANGWGNPLSDSLFVAAPVAEVSTT